MERSKFAALVRETRMEKNMTQQELADILHVTNKAVSKWERAISLPDIELLVPLSEALEIPLGMLLGVESSALSEPDLTELLSKLVNSLKERINEEIKSKKRFIHRMLVISVILLVVSSAILLYAKVSLDAHILKEYTESLIPIAFEDFEEYNFNETEDIIYFSIAAPQKAIDNGYHYQFSAWYDNANPSVVYFKMLYMINSDRMAVLKEGYGIFQDAGKNAADDGCFYLDVNRKEEEKQGNEKNNRNFLMIKNRHYYELLPQMGNHDVKINKLVYVGPENEETVLWER